MAGWGTNTGKRRVSSSLSKHRGRGGGEEEMGGWDGVMEAPLCGLAVCKE